MNQAISCAKESTYGTDATPTASQAISAILPAGWFQINGEVLERDIVRSTLTPASHVIGKKTVSFSFQTELKSSGSSARPEIDPLLMASGFTYTSSGIPGTVHLYTPVSDQSSMTSCTIYGYADGNLHKFTGCRLNFSVDVSAGGYGLISWEGQGIYNAVSATSLITPNPQTSLPPIAQSASLSMSGGYSAKVESVSIALNNTITERPDINSAEGLFGFDITARKPSVSMNPEAVLEATNTFWADWAANTAAELSFTIGSDSNNSVWFRAPKVITTSNQYTDRDGLLLYDYNGALINSSTTGDDELAIQFD